MSDIRFLIFASIFGKSFFRWKFLREEEKKGEKRFFRVFLGKEILVGFDYFSRGN